MHTTLYGVQYTTYIIWGTMHTTLWGTIWGTLCTPYIIWGTMHTTLYAILRIVSKATSSITASRVGYICTDDSI